ncbi:hypothetical protein PHYPSEUDO_001088 [Phytophthora pseudosyringae]|uniref:Uncharacterized protein n=1 Tax=Phytophthora pseudosyringae TaxID=221518 RepID=A0A8T1V3I0_9STRA|nr:hypothetical protein PHYPSEUDO_001088 [Phytophthora pseudosyringae]
MQPNTATPGACWRQAVSVALLPPGRLRKPQAGCHTPASDCSVEMAIGTLDQAKSNKAAYPDEAALSDGELPKRWAKRAGYDRFLAQAESSSARFARRRCTASIEQAAPAGYGATVFNSRGRR